MHEYGTYLKKYEFLRTYLSIDSDLKAAHILRQDNKSVAWVVRYMPSGWRPYVLRSRENCRYYDKYCAALRKGYLDIAWQIARKCGIEAHEHVVAQAGRHGQRAYPSARYLKSATKAKLLVLGDPPLDFEYWLDAHEIDEAADATEWALYQSLLSCLDDMLSILEENEVLAADNLSAELRGRMPELAASFQNPITMGVIWDPGRALPTVESLLEDFIAAPANVQLLLEALKEEHERLSITIRSQASQTWKLQLHGRNGRAPGVLVQRSWTLADLPKIAHRRVIVSTFLVSRWRRHLESWGLKPICWGEVLKRVPHPRGAGLMRWLVEAGRQLRAKHIEIRQATLAREVGVDPGTISRNFEEIMQRLDE